MGSKKDISHLNLEERRIIETGIRKAVTKNQKIILSSFGMSGNDVIKAANEISKQLAQTKTVQKNEENKEDDIDEQGEAAECDGENEIDFID